MRKAYKDSPTILLRDICKGFGVLFCTWKFLQTWYHIGDKAALELTAPENTKVGDAALHNLDTEQIHDKSLQLYGATWLLFTQVWCEADLNFPFLLYPLLAMGIWVSYFTNTLWTSGSSSVKKGWLHLHHRDVERIKLSSIYRDSGLLRLADGSKNKGKLDE